MDRVVQLNCPPTSEPGVRIPPVPGSISALGVIFSINAPQVADFLATPAITPLRHHLPDRPDVPARVVWRPHKTSVAKNKVHAAATRAAGRGRDAHTRFQYRVPGSKTGSIGRPLRGTPTNIRSSVGVGPAEIHETRNLYPKVPSGARSGTAGGRGYRPSTTTMLMLDDLVRISSSAVYSGELSHVLTCSTLPNLSNATRVGLQSPSMTSIAPPRATNLPP